MAIYSGQFKVGGVAFGPACFSLKEWENPGPNLPIAIMGDPNPDCTGTYIHAGEHDGWPYYVREDEAFVLWWNSSTRIWYIATEITDAPANSWQRWYHFEHIYRPYGSYTGMPHVFFTPIPIINVTGSTNPDCSGTYTAAGTHGGRPYWRRGDGYRYLYWTASWGTWLITEALDDSPGHYWAAYNPIQTVFSSGGAYTGSPLPLYSTMPDVSVGGESSPTVTGIYEHAGTYDGYAYWKRTDEVYSIWLDTVAWKWHISTAPGVTTPGCYLAYRYPFSGYSAQGTYVGKPDVNMFIPGPPVHGGILRLRIHGRRGGSGVRPGWYEATPITKAGYYRQSPTQRACRDRWGALMRFYATLDPIDVLRVNTERECVDVTGDLTPLVEGRYNQLLEPPFMGPWQWWDTNWTIWTPPGGDGWYLAATYPDLPDIEDPYWRLEEIAFYGLYRPCGTAWGTAKVTSVTYDGKYFYVGPHDEFPMWYNFNRKAWVWRSAVDDLWYLATTYPDRPTFTDTFWSHDGILASGEYEPGGFAEGTVQVRCLA